MNTPLPPPMPRPRVVYVPVSPSVRSQTSWAAIASLVCGIVWLVGVGSVFAIWFGYSARRDIDRSGGALVGRGLADAGIVLGIIGVISSILWFLTIGRTL